MSEAFNKWMEEFHRKRQGLDQVLTCPNCKVGRVVFVLREAMMTTAGCLACKWIWKAKIDNCKKEETNAEQQ
jgi:transcription elongation factor Elf1